MNQSHFSNEILALPIYKGRFDANKLTTDKVDIYFASYPQGTEIDLHKHDTDNHGVVTQGQLILIVDNQEKILIQAIGIIFHQIVFMQQDFNKRLLLLNFGLKNECDRRIKSSKLSS